MSAQIKSKPLEKQMASFIEAVLTRLKVGKRIRRKLPGGGRLHIDRALPFLCVYRQPGQAEDLGTERFVMSEASYLLATGGKGQTKHLQSLVGGICEVLVERFGVCLILEIWSGAIHKTEGPVSLNELSPRFKLVASKPQHSPEFQQRFVEVLEKIKVSKRIAVVQRSSSVRCAPPGLAPLLGKEQLNQKEYRLFGLEVSPVYRDPDSGELFPLVFREQRQVLSKAMRKVFFDFVRSYTKHRVSHRHVLGRRAMVKAVWESDRVLAEVSNSFDFLLQVTPVNAQKAWLRFSKQRFEKAPRFDYRPTTFEPVVLKRRLYRAPVEKIEDPALAFVFRQKLIELDRQITLIQDRNTPRFVHESSQLYGEISEPLVKDAELLLQRIPPRSRESSGKMSIDANEFASLAERELEYYRAQLPTLSSRVEVRDDVTGLMVSQGSLLISNQLRVPAARAEALLQHEVGTHVLTYFNGKEQPLQQLYTGLAGYDPLQEGLAVLSEYLVDGLSRPRLRLLAGRVLAGQNMMDGASFVEGFRALTREMGFDQRTAFTMTMRTYRGGGLTKDAVYLQGLRKMLKYVAEGGELGPLFVGKIGADHVPIIQELLLRGILKEPPLTPRYMHSQDALSRLETLRHGASVLDLIKVKRP